MNDYKREQARLRKKRQRDKESVTLGGVTSESVTLSPVLQKSVTRYPAILYALIDPIKDEKGRTRRDKLIAIVDSLSNHKLLQEVRYGVSGPTFDIVAEMLEVTH